MNFQSFGFLAFFLASLLLTLLAARRSQKTAEWCMLLSSFGAYFYLEPKAALLMLLSSFVSFCAVRFFEWAPRRDRVYAMAVAWHILVLVWFKYMNFILTTAEKETLHHSFIPLGISFFTFQQIWYLKECYEGKFSRVEGRQFLLVSFFYPTVSSGPILRPGSVLPQMETTAFRPSWTDAGAGLYAIAMGLGKKVLLADNMAQFVNKGWEYLDALTVTESWCVILGYTLQLYFDFSGYCDIATGFARCMGIHLPRNFDSPYRAVSLNQFWKRWHMTLTTFLRECVYFPLGGNRKGLARTYLNLCAVFLVSGLWHGAGWTFLIWGLLHGVIMVVERMIGEKTLAQMPKKLRRAITFVLINITWIFFRAPSIGAAWQMLKIACGLPIYLPAPWLGDGMLATEKKALVYLFPQLGEVWGSVVILLFLAAGTVIAMMPGNCQRRCEHFHPTWKRTLLTAALLTLSMLSFTGVSTFLYVNF